MMKQKKYTIQDLLILLADAGQSLEFDKIRVNEKNLNQNEGLILGFLCYIGENPDEMTAIIKHFKKHDKKEVN